MLQIVLLEASHVPTPPLPLPPQDNCLKFKEDPWYRKVRDLHSKCIDRANSPNLMCLALPTANRHPSLPSLFPRLSRENLRHTIGHRWRWQRVPCFSLAGRALQIKAPTLILSQWQQNEGLQQVRPLCASSSSALPHRRPLPRA